MTLSNQNSGLSGGDYLSEESVLRPYPLSGARKQRCCHLDGDGFTVITACFAVFTAALTVALIIQINYGSPQVQPHGAVATDVSECSRVGVEVLRAGGSAVDAGVAALFCVTVHHPHVVGPGGSGVMLVHDHKTNQTVVIDFMTAVPSAHRPDAPPPPLTGGGSIGVPGLLRGLEYAHHKFGRLSWPTLIQPSIKIAREGFSVSAQLANALALSNITTVIGSTAFDRTFFPKGVMLEENDYIYRKDYGDLLDIVARHGADGFYRIDLSAEEMSILHSGGSEVHVRDFENYQVYERPGIELGVQNMSIFTVPAPFGGPQLLTALQLLHNSHINHHAPPSFVYHAFIEALRRSYAQYIELGYTDEASLKNLTETLLSQMSHESIGISVSQANPQLPRLPDQPAAPVSVIDTGDQYVTIVAGLGSYFGSRLMTRHGILFNNHLANLLPSPPATPHRISRPFTTYTPVIITDAKQVCGARTVLASGGVGALVQVVSQLIFQHRTLMDSIEQPRIIVKPGLNPVFVEDYGEESKLPGNVRLDLMNMNHTFHIQLRPYISVNGVTKIRDSLTSWSDARGGGQAHRLEPSHTPHNASTHTL